MSVVNDSGKQRTTKVITKKKRKKKTENTFLIKEFEDFNQDKQFTIRLLYVYFICTNDTTYGTPFHYVDCVVQEE